MRDELFKALEARWHELYDQYEAVKAALPPIVRQEWTNRSKYDPRPHHYRFSPPHRGGVKSPEAIAETGFGYEYSFDAQDRVCIERYPKRGETFYTYTPDQIEITTYAEYKGRKLLKSIAWARFQSRRMQHYTNLNLNYFYLDKDSQNPMPSDTPTADEVWARLSLHQPAIIRGHEEYQYSGRRLTHIRTESIGSFDDPWIAEADLSYDAKGRLQDIRRDIVVGQIKHHVHVYRKRRPGETLASLAENAKAKLIDMIPKLMAAEQFNEPLYCLNLNYYRAHRGDYFPPELLVGLERNRQRVILDFKPDDRAPYLWWYLWHYDEDDDEPSPRLDVTDPDTLAACDALDTEINMRLRSDLAERALYEICRALNKLDWSKYAPVTPDFIVYACDQTEHEFIEDALRLSGATEAQIDDWYKRDML
jgi:hypothetical protein